MALDTLAYIKVRSPVKVSLIFAFGIILPSLFLGTLGIRSYRYENQVMHKESEERFAVVADLIETKVTERLASWISSLRTIGGRPAFQHLDYGQLIPILLSPPNLDRLGLETLFVFNNEERMVAPWPEALFRITSPSLRHDFDWGPLADDIDHLEHVEFVDKNVKAALQGYKALQKRNVPPSIQAGLLKNIAGDYRKLKQNRMAEATYKQLAVHYDSLPDFSGYPMGILGRQMVIDLSEQDKLWKEAFEIRLDLFEGLLLRRWNVTETQMANLLTDQRKAIEHTLAAKTAMAPTQIARWEQLQRMQIQLKNLQGAGEHFAKGDWPVVLHRIHQLGRLDQGVILEIPQSHPAKYVIAVPILESGSERRHGILVAVLPSQAIWRTFNDVMEALAKPAGLHVEWAHSPSSTAASSSLWKTVIERHVQTIDPPLQFHLTDAESSARQELFRRRQWIFSGMIGLSLIIILMGLVITFHAVKRETEIANLKSDFVANVSHELRTPLAAISHIGERLSLGRVRSEEERNKFYGLLGQETHRLKQLIEDVLDFSKVLAGKKAYKQEPLDIVQVVQKSVDAFHSKAVSRGFDVTLQLPEAPIRILGDARALQQTVLNLLDNAMKYSGASQKIDVTLHQNSSNAIVAVKDYGIGIAARDQDKIFEKFYRVERGVQGQTEGGVGLGLAMVKHVLDGHGGTIEVDSQVGQGSTFSLIFPLQKGRHA